VIFYLASELIVSKNLLIAAAVVSVTTPANTNPLNCYNISISTFYLEFYNTMSLDTAEQEHAATFLAHFQPILHSNCSPLSRILICTSYLPVCFHPSTMVLLPRRHLCSTIQSSYITTTVLITSVTIAILNTNPQKVHGTLEKRLIISILNAIKYTFNLQKRHSIQDNTFTVFAFSLHYTCPFINCGMLPFIFASYFDLPSSSYLPTISTTSAK